MDKVKAAAQIDEKRADLDQVDSGRKFAGNGMEFFDSVGSRAFLEEMESIIVQHVLCKCFPIC